MQALPRGRGAAGERAHLDFEQVSVADHGSSPSQRVIAGQELRVLLTALQRLPIDYQVVLELHYWESLTTDEIAAALALPPGTARSRLRRGRQLLEQSLAEVAGSTALVESTIGGLERWIAAVRDQRRARHVFERRSLAVRAGALCDREKVGSAGGPLTGSHGPALERRAGRSCVRVPTSRGESDP